MSKFAYIYAHVPFCEVICHYCYFYTARTRDADEPAFFGALEKDARRWEPELAPQIEAVYLGGGTPGASDPALVARFLEIFRHRFHPGTEVTMEANPTSLTRERVHAWKEAGVNRISLGTQSLNDALLKKLGRVHSSAQALRALEICLEEIPNVTTDLLYNVPDQPEHEPGEHALQLVRMGVPHVSVYHLTLEPEHFMHPRLPTDAFAWSQIRGIADRLLPLGFHHYEVASFSKPGFESRNNRNYWSGGPYLALGPSAHGFDGNLKRWWNVSDWREYARRVLADESPVAEEEQLTQEQRRIETIFTSLRTSKGLDLGAFQQRFGEDLLLRRAQLVSRWEKEGLGRVANGHLVLTFSGQMLADEIARSLL